jgi:hypothetical protein
MKAYLLICLDYDNKPDDDKEKKVADLLMSFGEFCENTEFKFQSIPRIGERINAEPLLKKWIEDDGYGKPYPGNKVFIQVYKALRAGSFLVEEVYHDLDMCTIHCSDIEYKDTE